MTIVCSSCNGEYEPVCSDGSKYFHVCPRSVIVEVDSDYQLKAGEIDRGQVAKINVEDPDRKIIERPIAERRNENISVLESNEVYNNRINEELTKPVPKTTVFKQEKGVKSIGKGVSAK